MAKVISLMEDIPEIYEQIYENYRIADQYREIEYNAAVKIQSWYRLLRVKAYMKHVTNAAVIIQKTFRGHLGRKSFRKTVEMKVKEMRQNYFDRMATLCQKTWRGYFSRKYIFNYYKRKAYLQAIQHKNEAVLNELKEYKEYMDRQAEEKKNYEKYQRLEEKAKREHYLISTRQISGVYNSPYKPAPAEMEYLMRNIKLDPSEYHDSYVKSVKANKFDLISLPEGLPPLTNKPQGPFRDPLDVRKQRYRPFSPSLRCETDYESVTIARKEMKNKEWTERHHDEIFIPIDKTVYKKPYLPMMNTTAKYGALDYGTKAFRDEKKHEELHGGRFKTLVPKIPEFHKLNRTYVS